MNYIYKSDNKCQQVKQINKIFSKPINLLTMQIAPYHQEQIEDEKWQVYQPRDQNLTLFKAFGTEIKNLLILTISLSVVYLIITLLSPFTILVIAVLFIATFMLLKMNLSQLKKQGLISKLNPKLRQLLLQKSIFDIYSDLLYFPLVTKIIAAFIKPLILKPHPQQLHHTFENLPDNVQQAIARKGLLSLAPKNIRQLIVCPKTIKPIPQNFGVETWQWKNYELYQNHHEKVHEQTIVKRFVEKIDSKVSWKGFMGMAVVVMLGMYKNPSRFKKILVQNGIFVTMIFLLFLIAVKLKKMTDQKKKNEDQIQIESIRINLLEKDD